LVRRLQSVAGALMCFALWVGDAVFGLDKEDKEEDVLLSG
jgi:hypothetical protein